MEESRATEYLVHFGLSRQEALVYEQLLAGGKQTGYEIARDTGISRSNAYTSLAALVEKGAAYLVEESAKKYIPVRKNSVATGSGVCRKNRGGLSRTCPARRRKKKAILL